MTDGFDSLIREIEKALERGGEYFISVDEFVKFHDFAGQYSVPQSLKGCSDLKDLLKKLKELRDKK